MLETAIPVLPAGDITASLDWWTRICGFTRSFQEGDYAGLARDGVAIHLVGFDAALARTVGDQTMLRLRVTDVTAFHAEYVGRGGKVHPNGALAKKPWGSTELAAIDPNGVCVTFFTP